MDRTDSTPFTWTIPDFANLSSSNYKLFSHKGTNSIRIACKYTQFSLCFESDCGLGTLVDHCQISLFRGYNVDSDPDLSVMWRISFINQHGDECLSRDIETGFSTKSECCPVFGGLYKIDQNFIRNPSNRLLTDGSLIIKGQITLLGKSLHINLKMPNAIAMKALESYESLLESSKHSDVVFVVGTDKKEFQLHKAILSVQSPVFSRMFDHTDFMVNRIEILDIKVEVFELLLNYIYGGNISLVQKYAADLLVAADKYQLDSLKQLCEQTLSTTTTSLTVDNVATVLTLAQNRNADELKSKCVKFITANASKVIDTEGWNQMDISRELFNELYRDIALHPNKKKKQKKVK